MTDPIHLSRAESAAIARRRRTRNIVLALVLAALVALFYLISLVKFGGTTAAH